MKTSELSLANVECVGEGQGQHNSNMQTIWQRSAVDEKSIPSLKGLSYEIDFKNVDKNWQILALIL